MRTPEWPALLGAFSRGSAEPPTGPPEPPKGSAEPVRGRSLSNIALRTLGPFFRPPWSTLTTTSPDLPPQPLVIRKHLLPLWRLPMHNCEFPSNAVRRHDLKASISTSLGSRRRLFSRASQICGPQRRQPIVLLPLARNYDPNSQEAPRGAVRASAWWACWKADTESNARTALQGLFGWRGGE